MAANSSINSIIQGLFIEAVHAIFDAMKLPFTSLTFKRDFHQLPSAFYQHVSPQGLDQPEWVVGSAPCAKLLGLDLASLQSDDALALLSGNAVFPSWDPIAMKYFGHQFGYLNPDLGDGRGVLLAEVETSDKQLWDLHLKGSGTTPFSRDGDGRAVLRSSIREFLCSEAMAALGIPTSRALCIVHSQTPVYREQKESAATLLRVAQTHIRFGHFEYAYHSGQVELLKQLSDYVVRRHFPGLVESPHAYADLFKGIAEKTAAMIAHWQAAGFAHGVMNTDNMSIVGDTFDYGPYGFLDQFNPGYICNHSDHEGRYAFDRQPAIAHWNLSVLAQAMSPIVDKDALNEGIKHFSETFNAEYLSLMRSKLGFNQSQEGDQALIFDTLNFLAGNRADYTYFFRQLSHGRFDALKDHIIDRAGFEAWLARYQSRCENDGVPASHRSEGMLASNPKYILRNYLAQTAIERAVKGDYSEVNKLREVLQSPFDEQPEHEAYADLPPDWAEGIEISCSS